jgi:hypothetical protein
MWLIKVEELTRKEIAARLNLTPKAVEKRIERGVRLLEEAYFGGKGMDDPRLEGSAVENARKEGEHDHG